MLLNQPPYNLSLIQLFPAPSSSDLLRSFNLVIILQLSKYTCFDRDCFVSSLIHSWVYLTSLGNGASLHRRESVTGVEVDSILSNRKCLGGFVRTCLIYWKQSVYLIIQPNSTCVVNLTHLLHLIIMAKRSRTKKRGRDSVARNDGAPPLTSQLILLDWHVPKINGATTSRQPFWWPESPTHSIKQS